MNTYNINYNDIFNTNKNIIKIYNYKNNWLLNKNLINIILKNNQNIKKSK